MATRSTRGREATTRPAAGAASTRRTTPTRAVPVIDARRLQIGTAVLEALHVRLADDLAGLTAPGDERNPYGTDFEGLVTAAQAATQVETDELLRYRVERRIAEIEAVQARMRAGTYGMCDTCGLPIPEERLEALPEAIHCLDCQRAHDRAHGRRAGVRHAA